MVRRRHRIEGGQVRPRAAEPARHARHAADGRGRAIRRCSACGLGLEFALSGHRELDDMISHHAEMARALAAELGLPGEVRDGARRRLRAVGRARLAGRLGRARRSRWRPASRSSPSTSRSRTASAASRRSGSSPGGARAASSIRRWPRSRGEDAILAGLDSVATWDAVIGAEPALAMVLSGERIDAALLAVAGFVDLKTPYALGHARAVAELAAAAAARAGLPEPEASHAAPRGARPRPRPARHLQRDLGQAGPARRRASGSACACSRT